MRGITPFRARTRRLGGSVPPRNDPPQHAAYSAPTARNAPSPSFLPPASRPHSLACPSARCRADPETVSPLRKIPRESPPRAAAMGQPLPRTQSHFRPAPLPNLTSHSASIAFPTPALRRAALPEQGHGDTWSRCHAEMESLASAGGLGVPRDGASLACAAAELRLTAAAAARRRHRMLRGRSAPRMSAPNGNGVAAPKERAR